MAAMTAPISIRLRAASPGLLALPWLDPLEKWPEDAANFRDLNVGPSRHLVRFVEADYVLYALKELPTRIADKEYRVLRELEVRELPAVRPVGLVDQPDTGNSILVTEYLEHSWQFRRLFRRLPRELVKHRERLLDAIAGLLVDLHREGVFWGDCSLANTLFKRDGQLLQAFLVDAETSEVHATLSDGQRAHDLDILVENVSGDLVDVSMELGESGERIDEDLAAAESIADRYRALWEELTHTETFGNDERYKVEARVRRLNELGFAIDELELEPATADRSRLRLKVAVANRRFHAQELRRLTGLEVGEGQAAILLNDLRAYQARLAVERPEAAARGGRLPLAHRRVRARHGQGGRRPWRRGRPDPGLLRPAGGPLAALGAPGPRRRRGGRAGRPGGQAGPVGVGRPDGGGRDGHGQLPPVGR